MLSAEFCRRRAHFAAVSLRNLTRVNPHEARNVLGLWMEEVIGHAASALNSTRDHHVNIYTQLYYRSKRNWTLVTGADDSVLMAGDGDDDYWDYRYKNPVANTFPPE